MASSAERTESSGAEAVVNVAEVKVEVEEEDETKEEEEDDDDDEEDEDEDEEERGVVVEVAVLALCWPILDALVPIAGDIKEAPTELAVGCAKEEAEVVETPLPLLAREG